MSEAKSRTIQLEMESDPGALYKAYIFINLFSTRWVPIVTY